MVMVFSNFEMPVPALPEGKMAAWASNGFLFFPSMLAVAVAATRLVVLDSLAVGSRAVLWNFAQRLEMQGFIIIILCRCSRLYCCGSRFSGDTRIEPAFPIWICSDLTRQGTGDKEEILVRYSRNFFCNF